MLYPSLEARRAALIQCGYQRGIPPDFDRKAIFAEMQCCLNSDCRQCGFRTMRWEPWVRIESKQVCYVCLFCCRLCGAVEEV